MSNLEWALMYHDKGWVIFPAQGKEPHYEALKKTGFSYFDEVERRRKASTDMVKRNPPNREQIIEWWTLFPNADIKAFTGKINDITVIDVDTHEGNTIYTPESVVSIVKELKVSTLMCTSGRLGKHLYFKYAPIKSGKYFEQVEVKNDGGFINLPPSVSIETKRSYTWDNPEMLLAQLPTIPELLIHKQKILIEPTRFDDLLINGAPSGSRNQSTAELVGKLLQSLQAAFYDWEQVTPELWTFIQWWNETKNTPPLGQRELQTIFMSILKTDSRNKLYGRSK